MNVILDFENFSCKRFVANNGKPQLCCSCIFNNF